MNFIVVAILSIEKCEVIAPINTPDFFNNLQNQIKKNFSSYEQYSRNWAGSQNPMSRAELEGLQLELNPSWAEPS